MKDSRKNEMTMETLEKVSGGGWESLIPYGVEIVEKMLDGGKDNGGGSKDSPAPDKPQYQQNNNENKGNQQNTQTGDNTMNVTN